MTIKCSRLRYIGKGGLFGWDYTVEHVKYVVATDEISIEEAEALARRFAPTANWFRCTLFSGEFLCCGSL